MESDGSASTGGGMIRGTPESGGGSFSVTSKTWGWSCLCFEGWQILPSLCVLCENGTIMEAKIHPIGRKSSESKLHFWVPCEFSTV